MAWHMSIHGHNTSFSCMDVPGGGAGGRQPPQFVGQTKPVGQYSLYSRAILAYYKKNGTNSVNFVENFVISGKLV